MEIQKTVDRLFDNKKIVIILTLILGLFNGFAFPPFYMWGFAVLSFSGFFALIRSAPTARLALYICLAYFIPYFLSFGAWVARPYYTFVIFFICACCGLFAVFWQGMLTWATRRLPFVPHLFFYSILWGTGEWLRGHLFSGIPWNVISYITFSNEIFAQTASLWGLYGLVIPTVLFLTAPAALLLHPKRIKSWGCLLLSIGILLGGYYYGVHRLDSYPIAYWPDTTLRLVQTNFQEEDRKIENTDELLQSHLNLSLREDSSLITAFIWPEAAINHHYIDDLDPNNERYNQFVAEIGSKIPPQSMLIAGFFRASIDEIPPFENGVPADIVIKSRWHGLGVINEKGFAAWYAKHHLLPFGEYFPFLNDSNSSGNFLNEGGGGADIIPGPGPSIIAVPGLPSFAPVVCYEAIFPCNIVSKVEPRPAWILVISNDSHYQETRFPLWMREMTRMRSIEEGLPLVRVTNTGTSTVFDGLGRTLVALPENTSTTIDVSLPKPSAEVPYYAQYGDLIFWAMTAGIFLPILVRYRKIFRK